MMRSQLKIVLAAMVVALIATITMAAPATTTQNAQHTSTTTTTVSPHKKTSQTTVKSQTTTTTAVQHKTTHITTTTTKPKTTIIKPKTTTAKPKTTTAKPKTTTIKPKTTTTAKPKTTTTKPKTTTTAKPKTTTIKPKTTTTAKPKTTTIKPKTTTTSAIPTSTPKPKKMGQTGAILSQTDFCIFLPPKFGGDIALNEDSAVAFCTKSNMKEAPNAQVLPAGFIQTAHFVSNTTANWVQVTGRINRSKYGLSSSDGGGQYDMRAPVGSLCSGYKSFVQLTEPDAEIYCIRCCQNKLDCPVNKSTHGCEKVLGGSYA